MAELGIAGLADAVEIGRGGYGVVFKARQVALDRDVAVKMLAASINDDSSLERFSREGRAMGSVSGHPNIVLLYQFGLTDGGQPYLVLEYLPKGSLGDRLSQSGPLNVDEATSIVAQLCGALETAHRAGVLHRDVKPENVLIGHFGEPKLGDFGIARLDSSQTGTQGLAASPAHVPPELLAGERATPRSDIYSLASTLYEVLAGQAAFVRDTDESMIPVFARLVQEAPPDLGRIGVPQPLQDVVFRAMAKAPDDRPQTALAFGEEINEARRAMGFAPVDIRVLDVAPPAAPGAVAPALPSPSAPVQIVPPTPMPAATVAPPGYPVAPTPGAPAPVGVTGPTPGYGTTGSGWPTGGAPTTPGWPTGPPPTTPPGSSQNRVLLIAGAAVFVVLLLVAVVFVATRKSSTVVADPPTSSSTSTSETVTSTSEEPTTSTTSKGPDLTIVPAGDTEFGEVNPTGSLAAFRDSGSDPAVGRTAPTLDGQQFDGSSISLPEKGKGAVVMIVAHWCDHCQRNVENITSYLEQNGLPEDVNLYAIVSSTSEAQSNYPPSSWLHDAKWPVPTLVDDELNTAGTAFGATSYTFFVVIGPDGKVVSRTAGELTTDHFQELVDSAR